MRKLAEICAVNPLRVALIAFAALALGSIAWRSIPLEYIYEANAPQLIITVQYPGATTDLVATSVTARLEAELRSIPGVRRLISRSMDGSASVTIDFDRKLAFEEGERLARERVGRLRYQLPPDVRDPQFFQVGGGNDQAVLEMAISSARLSRAELTEWVTTVARPHIEAVSGVGDVSLRGDAPRELQIEFDPILASAVNVSLQDVVTAIVKENIDIKSGYVQSASQRRILRVISRFNSTSSFEQIAVRKVGSMIVRLGSVSHVRQGAAEPTAVMRFNGRDCIAIRVLPLPKENVAQVSSRLRATMQGLINIAPPGVHIDTIVDNSEYALASLAAVERAMLEGAALTVLIVALFLRSAVSSFITALTLPISLLVTVAFLWMFGYSLNLFTLLALTLSIGILIDDSIVVRDNIVKHRQLGLNACQAAIQGTAQLGRAVASTTLVIVAVFLPLALAGGPLAPFIKQFGLTVAIGVSVSLIVSFTVDPALSTILEPHRILTFTTSDDRNISRHSRLFWVSSLVDIVFRGRYLIAAAMVGLLAICAWIARTLPTELMPEFDEGIAALSIQLPAGSPPEFMQAKAQQIEKAIQEFPEIVSVMTRVGTARSGNVITIFCRLVARNQRAADFHEIEEIIRQRLGLIVGVTTASTNLPIGILISGPDDLKLEKLRDMVSMQLSGIKGLTTVVADDVESDQAIVLNINRDYLGDAGVSLNQLADTLSAFVSGLHVGTWSAPNGLQYDIAIHFPKNVRANVSELSEIELTTENESIRTATPMHAVANIEIGDRPRAIERVDGVRMRRVQASVFGRPLGDVVVDVKTALANIEVPVGYQVAYGGKIRELEESQSEFEVAGILAGLLVFCTLTIFFGGMLIPLLVMTSIPLGVVGALGWIWLTNGTLNVFSGVGLLLVAGIVAKNGILLIDFARRAERDGISRQEAITEALKQRIRPILMTSIAMMLGMLPLAFGLGHGGEQLSAIGQAVVSGIASSTLLSLIVVPALYSLLPSERTGAA